MIARRRPWALVLPLCMATGLACGGGAAKEDDGNSVVTNSWESEYDSYGGEESGGAEDTNFGMDDDMPLAAFVAEIKRGQIELGTLVRVNGVITTSAATKLGGREVQFVRDPGESRYAGLRLDIEIWGAHEMGDLFTAEGTVGRNDDGYFLEVSQIYGGGMRELPGPIELDARELLPEAEQRESLADMVVAFAELDGEPLRVIEDDIGRETFSLAPGLIIDLSAFIEDGEAPAIGTRIEKVTGVFVLDGNEARVLVRSADELVTG